PHAQDLISSSTVALAGCASRMGWIDSLPGALGAVSHPAVIVLASILSVVEFVATLIPGVASVWETVHTAIRPPAAAALAVLTAWHGDPALIAAAALLGGGLGFATRAPTVAAGVLGGWSGRRHPPHQSRASLHHRPIAGAGDKRCGKRCGARCS